jgi:hypothetical protein
MKTKKPRKPRNLPYGIYKVKAVIEHNNDVAIANGLYSIRLDVYDVRRISKFLNQYIKWIESKKE